MNKSTKLYMRISPHDKAEIQDLAKELGLSVSDLVILSVKMMIERRAAEKRMLK